MNPLRAISFHFGRYSTIAMYWAHDDTLHLTDESIDEPATLPNS
jgi:hypothetical protein